MIHLDENDSPYSTETITTQYGPVDKRYIELEMTKEIFRSSLGRKRPSHIIPGEAERAVYDLYMRIREKVRGVLQMEDDDAADAAWDGEDSIVELDEDAADAATYPRVEHPTCGRCTEVIAAAESALRVFRNHPLGRSEHLGSNCRTSG